MWERDRDRASDSNWCSVVLVHLWLWEREVGGLYAHLITCKLNLIETSIQSVTRTNQLAAFPMFLYSDLWHYYHLHWTRKRPCLASWPQKSSFTISWRSLLGELVNWFPIKQQWKVTNISQTSVDRHLVRYFVTLALSAVGMCVWQQHSPHKHRSIPRGDSPHTLTHVN